MSYQSEVLADAPLAYYRLGETSGATMVDSSGNGRNGTYTSMTLGQTGALQVDKAVKGTGTSSRGLVPGSAWMDVPQWTVIAWARLSSSVTDSTALVSRIYQPGLAADPGWVWNVDYTASGQVRVRTYNGGLSGVTSAAAVMADQAWHMIAATYDGTTLRLYVDGALVGSVAVAPRRNTSSDFVIGNSRSPAGDDLTHGSADSYVDEVSFHGSALSGTRIAALYAEGKTLAARTDAYRSEVMADAPVAYWPLDEMLGNTFADASGNGHHLSKFGLPVHGGASAGAGLPGASLAVFGDNDTADGGVLPSTDTGFLTSASSFSYEAWIRSNDANTIIASLFNSSFNGSTRQHSQIRLNASGQLQFNVANASSNQDVTTTADLRSPTVWHHVVVTYDAGTVKFYVDGSLVKTETGVLTPGPGTGTPLRVGAGNYTTDSLSYSGFKGSLDEVALYGTALSLSRVQAHYNAATSAAAAPKTGTASGAFSFAGSATGKRVTAGVAAGALAFSGAAVGKAPVKGSAVGSIAYMGAAAGVAPAVGPRTGSAAGSFSFTGAATGSSPVNGSASGAFSFTGAAAGVTPAVGMKYGTAAGSFSWVGAATGAPANRAGSAAGGFSFVGAAAGTNTAIPMGTATGTVLWRGVAFGANGTTTIPGWDVDDSGQTTLGLGGSGELDVMPPLALPPAGYVERPLIRRSVVVPAMHTISGRIVDPVTGGIRIPDDVYDALPLAAPVQEVGVPHILFPNFGDLNDVTYFRGGIIRIGNMRMEEPFGDVTLSIEIPLLTSMDPEPNPDNPDDPLYWTMNRANVEIVLRHPDGTVTRLWAGHIISHDIGNDSSGAFRRLTAVGSLRQAATDVLKVPNMLDPTDIGTLIPRALNGVASRRYPKIGWVSTGIMSRQRGSWSDSPLGYTQSLLSTSFTPAGNQWTVAKVEGTRRTYELRPKDTTVSLTVTNGARGVEVDLTRDATSTRNVIYGHGVADNGYAWWNYKYPNLSGDTAPLYPGGLMGLGASGAGVSLWQQRVKDLGYSISVDGTISSSDVLIIKTVQRRFGVQVDGVIGPQTWAATFDVGGNGGDLSGVIRLPLAADPRTQPFLYNADGSVAGDNPDFDRNVIIYADDVDFGSGITRAEGIQSAQQILERESEPGLTGRIVLNSDPREMSRFLIRPGRKIKLVGFERADRVLHITAVDIDWQSLSVTLEVDEKSRDAMTVAQIRERDKEARRDPARRPGNVNRRSRLDVDQVVPFDGESGAGRIPKFATYGGLWSVIRIPVSETGRVAMVDMQTSGPTSQLYVAMFGAPIQPAHLVKYVGNPSSTDARWEDNREVLEETFGWIEAFGSPDEPGGYWPGLKSKGKPLTGRLKDTGGFEYVSAKPPWIWVAVYTPVSSYVQGRILPAPVI